MELLDFEKKLIDLVERYIEEQGITGVGVGIVKDKEMFYVKGFGVKDVNTKEPVTPESLFHMASVSKTFVATAIMQLVEKGVLDIYRPVIDYLPYFKLKDERYKNITVQHMLSHMSGIPDVDDYEWDNPSYDDEALERSTRRAAELGLLWEPGEKTAYSNLAYEILGDVIAKCSGMSFEEYIRENMLDPLKMKESSFLNMELSKELLTSPHVMGRDFEGEVCRVFPYNRMHAPSSTLCSSPIEMCNYATAILNNGEFKGRRIFATESYEEMIKSRARIGGDFEIGLSWFMEEYDGVKTICHSGGDKGFTSDLILQPDRGTAVVVMNNCDYGNISGLSRSILDLANGHDAKPVKMGIERILLNKVKEGGIKAIRDEFINAKLNQNDNLNVTEDNLNILGYLLIGMDRLDEAIEILEFAISEYPDSSNLYDSIGESYLKKGDRELSVLNYKKAVELDADNTHAVETLKKIIQ